MTDRQLQWWFSGAIASFLLAALSITLMFRNFHLQTRLAVQQTQFNGLQKEIQRGQLTERYLAGILDDLRIMAPTHPRIQELLNRHGGPVRQNPSTSKP